MKRREKPQPDGSVAPSSSWTAGSWLAHYIGFGVIVAVGVAAVAGLALHFMPREAAVAGPAGPVGPAGLSVDEQTAGSLAVGFVGAWLDATRDHPEALQAYVSTEQLTLPENPASFRDLRLVSVDTQDGAPVVSVNVAAAVSEQQPSKEGEQPTSLWVDRYFQVLVQTGDGVAGVVGLPAPIAAPSAPDEGVSLTYSDELTTTEGAGAAAKAFLEAYLAGIGDVTRLVTPGADVTAITPAQFTSVSVERVSADREASVTPADGEEVRLLVTSVGTTAAGGHLTSTYTLTATARAGRWEITSIDQFPAFTN